MSLALEDILAAINTLHHGVNHNRIRFFEPYPWQAEAIAAGLTHPQRLLMAGNQVGKTEFAAFEFAMHALGEYPDDWDGFRFDSPPVMWACGTTGEQIRDVIQARLFGEFGEHGLSGGMIPADRIKTVTRAIGTPLLARDLHIQHSQGISKISLKSYTQNVRALMGSVVDYAWIDEQPGDDEYGQILTRTINGAGGAGGRMMMTFTPELGVTPMLQSWLDGLKPGQWMRTITWDDAPHITPERGEQILAGYPSYQRDMRRLGVPLMGAGLVFQVSEERFVIDPPEIKDYWSVGCGIDFGYTHPFAAIWVAHDRDSDVMYVFDEYSESEKTPPVHTAAVRSRGANIPVIYPPDATQHEKGSGAVLKQQYVDAGMNLIAMFDNYQEKDRNFVEPGITEIINRIQTRRLFISRKCDKLIKNMRLYHRDNKGKIIKAHDDEIDAMRYIVMTIGRYGKPWSQRRQKSTGSLRPARGRADY